MHSLLLLSLIVLISCVISLLFVLNKMIFAYENEKLEALTNQIKQKNGLNIFNKNLNKNNFGKFDLNKSIKKSKNLVANLLKDTADQFQKIQKTEILQTKNVINSLKNLKEPTKNVFYSITSLIKPIKKGEKEEEAVVNLEQEIKKEEIYKEEVQNMVDKVEQKQNESGAKNIVNNTTATIDMATQRQVNIKKDEKTFAYLEQKIMKKLQESGMQNYDIWLELGKFYLKYEQEEKAKEIFALVLKHAPQDSKTKEAAKNELIGLA